MPHTSCRFALIAAGAAVSLTLLSGSAFAHAAAGGGGHPAAGHAAVGGHPGGHMEAGHGFEHGGHGEFGHAGFERGGHHYHYGPDGVVVEDCCYTPEVPVAPVFPLLVPPFGLFVR